MKISTLLITVLLLSIGLSAQKKYTISGYVKEAGSKELLLGVNIYVDGTQTGTSTNNYGFYSLTLPEGDYTIVYSFVGYKVVKQPVSLEKNITNNIELEGSIELSGVEIVGEKTNISEDVRMSVVTVPIKQIKEIPAFLGEKDVFKVLQLLPGVNSGSEGSSGLYVRGGGVDQNLIILDDAPVYNAYHLFGFFSVFNGDAIKSVELTKGGFPARYGGRLSSVIDMNMKDGNKTKFGGEGSVGIISSKLMLEGPIIKNKASFVVSARRTYLDLLTIPFQKFYNNGAYAGYFFYDMNAKINYDISDKDKLYLSFYSGKDKFYVNLEEYDFVEKIAVYWQNQTATLRWNHLFNNKLFANTSVIYSKYDFNFSTEFEDLIDTSYFKLNYLSGIEDYTAKIDFNYIPNSSHYLRAGASVTSHVFTPSAWGVKGSVLPTDINNSAKKIGSIETGLYIEDEIRLNKKTKLNLGLRFSDFFVNNKNYSSLEPRFMGSYMLSKKLSVKAAYTFMSQYIHLLSSTGISLPIDLWVPSTDIIAPKNSHQIAFGFAKDFNKPEIAVSLEGYYKTMHNIIAYKEGAQFINIGGLETDEEYDYEESVVVGDGVSYGAELLVQKEYGKFTGWIGYTLSWTKFQFDDLNFGKEFYARHDRRHDVSVVGMYKVNDKLRVSGAWVYGTGNAITMAKTVYAGIQHSTSPYGDWYYTVNDYGEKNGFRMAPYHRLDIGLMYDKKYKWGGVGTWEVSIYNAYNRANPYFYYTSSEQGRQVLKQVSLFPIVPSVSYSLKF